MREQEERTQQRRVAEVAQARRECEDRLCELGEAKSDCTAQLAVIGGVGRLDVPRIAAVRYYASQLEFQEIHVHEKLRVVDEELARRRDDLAQASKRRQVMQKLREHQRTRHRLELEKHEQGVLDEVANVQSVRRMREADYEPVD